jgi:hypothetical protein
VIGYENVMHSTGRRVASVWRARTWHRAELELFENNRAAQRLTELVGRRPAAIERVDHRGACPGRRGQYLSLICAAIAFAASFSPVSNAQIVLGPTVSLASLTNGQDLIVGDKEFTDFSISGGLQASQVNVTSITENCNFGIRFSGAFISGASPLDFTLGYQVSVTNSPNLISAANLLFNGTAIGAGLAQVVEQVFTNNNNLVGQLVVFASATSNQLSASLPITPPQKFLTLSKDVHLEATLPAFATISTIDQTFTQIPEPGALILVAAGVTGFVLLRRRRH